jgi:phage shock protein E
MSLLYFSIVLVLTILYVLYKRSGQIPVKVADEHVKNGALVIDVRSSREFESGHLAQAMNMPLDEIETHALSQIKNKRQVLLLHCQSGIRSRMAVKRLEKIGYQNVYNMGSYTRAFRIVSGRNL